MVNINAGNIFLNCMKEYEDLRDKLKEQGKDEDYIFVYSKGYFQGKCDTEQKMKSELETYKKIAEYLAGGLKFWSNSKMSEEELIDWARKEVEKDA